MGIMGSEKGIRKGDPTGVSEATRDSCPRRVIIVDCGQLGGEVSESKLIL